MKKLVRDLFRSLVENWVIYILGSGGIVTTVLGWFFRTHIRNWLVAKHSFEISGWFCLLLLILFVFFVGFFVVYVFREQGKLKDAQSIKNALHKYLRHCTDDKITQENTFVFAGVDKQQNLRRGSAKRYIKEVIQETGNWTVISEGDKNIRVKRDDSQRLKDVFDKCR